MLSDGGYGAIMTILATIILKVFKLEESTKKFMKLMVYCGISTMFWGLLFGGWFGIPNIPAVWFNPTEDPELLLSFSLLFGAIHIYVGLGVRAANLIKDKNTLMRFLIRCSGIYCLPDSYCLYFPISKD